MAHESELACISLNLDGTRLATASDKGTLIRIFDTHTFQQLQELRRGRDRARIYCISFNPGNQYVASSSDRGTIHVWSLNEAAAATGVVRAGAASTSENRVSRSSDADLDADGASAAARGSDAEEAKSNENAKSSLSFLGGLVPSYFQSEWSFAQFRTEETHSIVAFGSEPNTIIVVGAKGNFWKASFENGNEMKKKHHCEFVRSRGEDAAAASAGASATTASGATSKQHS